MATSTRVIWSVPSRPGRTSWRHSRFKQKSLTSNTPTWTSAAGVDREFGGRPSTGEIGMSDDLVDTVLHLRRARLGGVTVLP